MGRKVCLVAAVAVACAVASTVASAVASDVASAVASDACTSPIVAGQVPFNNTGTVELWSVVTQNMKEVQVSAEGALTVQHGARAYLVPGCPQSFTGGMYEGLDLVNAVLSFTVDLSTAGCACNAAMYTTAMPAVNRSQEPDPTRCQDFYCDANDVCGLWCPEMDIMEANTAALQITPHKCDAPTGHFYPACDGGGCALNTYRKLGAQAYGPGSGFVIDSTRPFTVSTTFSAGPDGQLSSVGSVLSQLGSSGVAVLTHTDATCGAGYLGSMTPSMESMVPIFSVWGDTASTMSWLDEPPCSNTAACDSATASMVITNLTYSKTA